MGIEPARIELANVAFTYADREVFTQLDLRLEPGWTAVVGPNGAGKTTLARLLLGELTPTSGRVQIHPRGARTAHVEQTVDAITPAIETLAQAEDPLARRLLGAFELHGSELSRWPTLSPGERRRWQLAAALASEPDVLVLDEPDAHLDEPGRRVTLRALEQFRKIGVLVSHRRDVLDALATRTLWVEDGRVDSYAGGYAQARAQRTMARDALEKARSELRQERNRVQAARARIDEEQRAAHRQKSAGARMKGPRDSDGRGFMRAFQAHKASASLSHRSAATEARVERIDAELERGRLSRQVGTPLVLRAKAAPQQRIAALVADAVCAGTKRVLGRTSLLVEASSRVRIDGPNGSGKTTLLEALARKAVPDCLLLSQTITQEHRQWLARDIRAMPALERGRLMALVAALGTEPAQLFQSAQLSPGEAKKVALARALSLEVSALFLDEPTNDLDLPSIERLQAALEAYRGALVLVTHDHALARATTHVTWRIHDQACTPCGQDALPGGGARAVV